MVRLIFISVLLHLAAARGTAAEKAAEVRFLAEMVPNDLGQVVLLNAEIRSEPFDLPMNNLSPFQKAPARAFGLWSLEKNLSLANIRLPDQGDAFLVLLLRSPEGGYRPVVMPAENPSFKGGDIYFYNNTNKVVLGLFGETKLLLDPGKGTVLTPRGFGDNRFYHAMLGVRESDGDQVIKSMKWPASKTMRNYVFFYFDSVKKRITYRAVDEFVDKPAPQP